MSPDEHGVDEQQPEPTNADNELAPVVDRMWTDPNVEPLADALDDVAAALRRYVVFPCDEALDTVALWVAATHAQPVWQHATRLVIKSPEKRCGKSRLLDLVEALSYASLITVNASVSAIFRSIRDEEPPTLIVDEADAIWKRRGDESVEELRGLFNAGFQRNRPALRCVGPQQTPTEFPTFAMVAFAAIGDVVPDTITDRAATISLRRRLPHEQISPFRHRRDGLVVRGIGRELHAAVRVALADLEYAEPVMPIGIEDRAADLWEPLLAVADAAGGEWSTRARQAAVALTDDADDAARQNQLLADFRDVFDAAQKSVLSTDDVLAALRRIDEAPWGKFELSAADLAFRLRPYGVGPKQVRPDGRRQVRGYARADLEETFARYLRPVTTRHHVTHAGRSPDGSDAGDIPAVTTVTTPTPVTSDCDEVTAGDALDDQPCDDLGIDL